MVVAKSLLTEPQVLMLDEPTRGIDVGAKAEIFEIMNRLADDGLAILFVSSELPEMFTIPDRVMVLSKGRVTGEFLHDQLSEEALVLAAGARPQTEHPICPPIEISRKTYCQMSTTLASPAGPVLSKPSGLSLGVLLFRLRALIALFVLLGIFSVLSPAFFTQQNLIILVGQTAINAIMAVGMTFVILTGGIDLSVGSTVGLAAMMSGLLIDRGLPIPPLGVAIYFNVPMIIVFCLCLGVLVGAFNGLLITRFNVAPFIATLGTLYIARGTAQLSNNGATFPNLVGKADLGNTGFPVLGAGSILGIPIVIWIMFVFAAVAGIRRGQDAVRTPGLRGRRK